MSPHDRTNTTTPRRSARVRKLPEQVYRDGKSDQVATPSTHEEIGSSSREATMSTSSTKAKVEDAMGVTDEDDLCPVCQLLLYRPVKTECNHTLCEACMAHWADVCVTSQMTIVDVDEEPSDFNSVTGLEAKCPMCRTQTSASLDTQRSTQLARRYPKTWKEREAEEQEVENGNIAIIQNLTLYIGNRHQEVSHESDDANKHEWTFFVKPSRTDIIEEVQIHLHPTFRQNRIVRQRPPYQITRLGWGIFTITAYVILKAGYSWVSDEAEDSPDGASKGMLPLEWTLDFESYNGKGSMGRCRLKVKNDRNWEDVGEEEVEDAAELRRLVRQYQRDGRYEPDDEF